MRFRRLISLLLCVLAFCPAAFSQNTKQQEAKKARLEKEIAILDRQLGENASKSRSALIELTLVQKKVSMRRELLAQSDAQIASYDRQIRSREKQIGVLEGRLDTLTAYYSRLVNAVYKNRDAKLWYMYIVAADNLGQAYRRYGYFRNMAANLNEQAARIMDTRTELQEEKEKLRSLKSEEEVLRVRRRAEVEALAVEEAASQKLVESLKRDRSRYEKELAAKQKQVDALNREIERIIREAIKSSKGSGATKPKKPVDYTLAAEFSKNKGKLPWPADGPVTDHFGQRYHPVFSNVKLPFNNGIDISMKKDAKVSAVFDGVVKNIMMMPGYNQCVLVQHGNYFTFYCKLKNCNVKPGDKVKTGQAIGVVDTIGGETKLHFQVWKDNAPQNPESWLRPRD